MDLALQNGDKCLASRLKVLVVAYECSPVRGHAPGSAWNLVTRLAQWNEVLVITEESQYRAEIEAHIQRFGALAALSFEFIPSGGRGYQGTRPVLPFKSLWLYRRWLRAAYRKASELHAARGFNVVHHLRGNSFREPGFLRKIGAPYVWGPVGGTTGVAMDLMRGASSVEKIAHIARNAINWSQLRLSPSVRAAFRSASCVIAQTKYDQQSFERVHRCRCVVVHEQNSELLPVKSRQAAANEDAHASLRVLWVGQCISRKGFPILIDALRSVAASGGITVDVAGDGPSKRRWMKLTEAKAMAGLYRWHGWKSREEVLQLMSEADVLAFTSLLEGTPATVMEALSVGLPVICLRHCGQGDVVDASCGAAIEPSSYEAVVAGVAQAIDELRRNPSLRIDLRRGAVAKAREFSWDQAAVKINETYRHVQAGNRPLESGDAG